MNESLSWLQAQRRADLKDELFRRPSWRLGWYVGRNNGGASCIIDQRASGMELSYSIEDLQATDFEAIDLA